MVNGVFECEAQASAVLVPLREVTGQQKPHTKVLVTVQHVLRSKANKDDGTYEGPYWTEYRAWPAGVAFTERQGKRVILDRELTPSEDSPFTDIEDFAFLRFLDVVGFPAVRSTVTDELDADTPDLTVVGYDAGADRIEFVEDKVLPVIHENLTFRHLKVGEQIGILSGGHGAGSGASGGGVFLGGSLVGIYRGKFPSGGGADEQLFMPVRWIIERRRIDIPSLEPAAVQPVSGDKGSAFTKTPQIAENEDMKRDDGKRGGIGPRHRVLIPAVAIAVILLATAVWVTGTKRFHRSEPDRPPLPGNGSSETARQTADVWYSIRGKVVVEQDGGGDPATFPAAAGVKVTPVYKRKKLDDLTAETNSSGIFEIRTKDVLLTEEVVLEFLSDKYDMPETKRAVAVESALRESSPSHQPASTR